MNLNQTFCASNCKNYKCQEMLSMSKVCAAERQKVVLKHEDKSAECSRFKA